MTEAHRVDLLAFGRHFTLAFASPDDHIAGVIRKTGTFYESEMLADARSRLFYAECAVDVGAHVGNHTLYFAQVLGLRTLAFEPNPRTFALLRANIEDNKLAERCIARHAAVGAGVGRARAIDAGAANSGMATVAADPTGEVDLVRLDDALAAEPRIDLIKIDVEGWEGEVLSGAVEVLRRHRPLLYIEIMQPAFAAVQAQLRDAGYLPWMRFNATPTFLFLPVERLRIG